MLLQQIVHQANAIQLKSGDSLWGLSMQYGISIQNQTIKWRDTLILSNLKVG